jgi:hypothetical protein
VDLKVFLQDNDMIQAVEIVSFENIISAVCGSARMRKDGGLCRQ